MVLYFTSNFAANIRLIINKWKKMRENLQIVSKKHFLVDAGDYLWVPLVSPDIGKKL